MRRSKSSLDSDFDNIDDEGQNIQAINESPVTAEKQSQTHKNNMNAVAHVKTNNNEKQNKYGITGEKKTREDIDFRMFIEDKSINGISHFMEEFGDEKPKINIRIVKRIIKAQQPSSIM